MSSPIFNLRCWRDDMVASVFGKIKQRAKENPGSHWDKFLHSEESNFCHYCEFSFSNLNTQNVTDRKTLDHIVCKKDGGTNSVQNLVFSCDTCNVIKGTSSYEFFKKFATERLIPLRNRGLIGRDYSLIARQVMKSMFGNQFCK